MVTANDNSTVNFISIEKPLVYIENPDIGNSSKITVSNGASYINLSGQINLSGCSLPVTLKLAWQDNTETIGQYSTNTTVDWNARLGLPDGAGYGSWPLKLVTVDGKGTQIPQDYEVISPDPNGLPVPVVSCVSTFVDGETYYDINQLKSLEPGQTHTLHLNLKNTGGDTDNGYLSVSCTQGLEIIRVNNTDIDPGVHSEKSSYPGMVYNFQTGYFPINTEGGGQKTAINQLVDIIAPYSYGTQRTFAIEIRAKNSVSSSDKVYFRSALDRPDQPETYERDPVSGIVDQQGWAAESLNIAEGLTRVESLQVSLEGNKPVLSWRDDDTDSTYKVYKGNTPDFDEAELLETGIKGGYCTGPEMTSFENYYFWVQKVGPYGNDSSPCMNSGGKIVHVPAGEGPIVVDSSYYEKNATWPDTGRVYAVNGLRVRSGGSLRIDPGVVVKFRNTKSGLNVHGNGVLTAEGTSDAPVVFTSYKDDTYGGDTNADGPSEGSAEDWQRIDLAGAVGSSLKHCVIRYGGNDDYWGDGEALEIDGLDWI